jgi:hypothetical protein
MPQRLLAAWVEPGVAALALNAATVTVLSVDEILKPDGYVAQLRKKGYRVDDP